MKYESSSLKTNMALNTIRGILKVIFPLITFPYVSRILGVANLGKYNFAASIVSYFILIAGLGINSYAIREGARIRNDKIEISTFANEMFSINLISTIVSYCALFFLILLVKKIRGYETLIVILSLQIIFNTIGVEWVYSIYEDYVYITVRSVIFQLISLFLLFILVRDRNCVNQYAFINVISAVGSSLFNFYHSRHYLNIRVTKHIDWKKHLKPILVLFALSTTVTIYVSSDTTILGFFCGDRTVGIYSVSVKVYSVVKNILASVLVVSIPRLSSILGTGNREEFNRIAFNVYNTLITLAVPVIVGVIILRKDIVWVLSGTEYMASTSSLSILSIALLFCLGAWFWGQCILIPLKKENTLFKITVFSAVINVVLNLLLIPIWQEKAAAFTTVIAEAFSFFLCRKYGRQYVKIPSELIMYVKVAVGCIAVALIGYLGQRIDSLVLRVLVTILFSAIVYVIIEILLKNDSVLSLRKLKN